MGLMKRVCSTYTLHYLSIQFINTQSAERMLFRKPAVSVQTYNFVVNFKWLEWLMIIKFSCYYVNLSLSKCFSNIQVILNQFYICLKYNSKFVISKQKTTTYLLREGFKKTRLFRGKVRYQAEEGGRLYHPPAKKSFKTKCKKYSACPEKPYFKQLFCIVTPRLFWSEREGGSEHRRYVP